MPRHYNTGLRIKTMKYNLPQDFARVSIFSSEISDGIMAMGTEEGRQNAKKFLNKTGAKPALCHMTQIHENRIILIDHGGLYENVDGIVTRENLTLAVKTADCVPVMIYDPETKLIGAIHAGRKSIVGGILSESLLNILNKCASDPNNLRVFLGPHIRVASYNLLPETTSGLKDTKWARFMPEIEGRIHFDQTAATCAELEEIGIKAENIVDCGIDTFEDGRFFSARRTPKDDKIRFLTVIFKNEN